MRAAISTHGSRSLRTTAASTTSSRSIDGQPVAQNGIEVTQSFEMSPASGPVGTPIELTGQRARLADDGEHVGGELGQPRPRAWCRRPARRDPRSRDSAPPVRPATHQVKLLYRLAGTGLFESRAVADRPPAAARSSRSRRRPGVPHACGVRGALSAAARAGIRDRACRREL